MSPFRYLCFLLIFALVAILIVRIFIPIGFWVPASFIFAIISVLAIGSFTIQSGVYVNAYNFPKHERAEIAITFDDGPSEFTPEILDILKAHKALATFFCIGRSVERYPDTLKRIQAEGHDVGNHTYTHSYTFPLFSRKRISRELKNTSWLISEHAQLSVSLFRPPFGVTNPAIVKAAADNELKIIGWNLRSLDGTVKNPDRILHRILPRIRPGTVLLLHDTRPDCATILRAVLREMERMKLKSVTVSQIFDLNEMD